MLINRGMTERRETSDLQPRTEEKPIKLTNLPLGPQERT